MQMVFSKVHPACHSIVNGIKQEVTLKMFLNGYSLEAKTAPKN